MITHIYRVLHNACPLSKTVKWMVCAALFTIHCSLFTGCSDMLYDESDQVIYADNHSLSSDADTLWSVAGIMNKMQVIADRTILLGELRGDLVDVTSHASSDLRDMAFFSMSEGNKYNSPRDYYAIINNCNYFIANADTALRDNRNDYIFMKEYAAVKAFRAWTYLQLVLNYGSVSLNLQASENFFFVLSEASFARITSRAFSLFTLFSTPKLPVVILPALAASERVCITLSIFTFYSIYKSRCKDSSLRSE